MRKLSSRELKHWIERFEDVHAIDIHEKPISVMCSVQMRIHPVREHDPGRPLPIPWTRYRAVNRITATGMAVIRWCKWLSMNQIRVFIYKIQEDSFTTDRRSWQYSIHPHRLSIERPSRICAERPALHCAEVQICSEDRIFAVTSHAIRPRE